MGQPSRSEVEKQLARILGSEVFGSGKKTREASLLEWLVAKTLNGENISREDIWSEVFGKTFKAHEEDTLIKTHVSLLRKRLSTYDAASTWEDLVEIAIAPHTYEALFTYKPGLPAFKEVQRGLKYLNDYLGPDRFDKATEHIREAVQLQPDFADAHGSYALLSVLCTLDIVPPKGEDFICKHEFQSAAEEAGTALALSSDCWLAHISLGTIHTYLREWDLADKHFGIAIDLDKDNTTKYPEYSTYLIARGRYKEALKIAKLNANEHYLNGLVLYRCALSLYMLRRYGEAMSIFLDLIERGADEVFEGRLRAMTVLTAVARNKFPPSVLFLLGGWPELEKLYYYDMDNYSAEPTWPQAVTQLAMDEKLFIQPLRMAVKAMLSEEHATAIERLSTFCDSNDPLTLVLHVWPLFDPLRHYPEYHQILTRLGLPKGPKRA